MHSILWMEFIILSIILIDLSMRHAQSVCNFQQIFHVIDFFRQRANVEICLLKFKFQKLFSVYFQHGHSNSIDNFPSFVEKGIPNDSNQIQVKAVTEQSHDPLRCKEIDLQSSLVQMTFQSGQKTFIRFVQRI